MNNSCRLNNTLLNDICSTEETEWEIKTSLEFYDCDISKSIEHVEASLRGKFRVLNAYIQKSERSQIHKSTIHLKALEK